MDQMLLMDFMLDAVSDGLIAVDAGGEIICANSSARAILCTEDDPVGHDCSYLEQPKLGAFIMKARNGDSADFEINGRKINVIYLDMILGGLRRGAVLRLSLVGERTRADRLREEFTANVSHELKTPLTSILGYAEMIRTGLAQDKDVRLFAGRIESESKRMLTLISDIIRLSQVEAMGGVRGSEHIDLYAVVQDSIEILRPAAVKRNVTITLTGGSMEVLGERRMFDDLVYNLIDNAIRYNRDNGLVSVRVSDKCLVVRDTGIGIPKSHLPRIFERFYRVDKSRSKATGGTGLGLAIVKHICEQLHASVNLESREGIGTEITVRFE